MRFQIHPPSSHHTNVMTQVVLIALLRKFVFLECENNFDNKSVEDEDDNKSKPKNNLCIKEYFTSICIGAVAVMNN